MPTMSGREFLLTSIDARRVLAARAGEELEISLDLNLSRVRLSVMPEGLLLPSGRLVSRAQLAHAARRRGRVFALGSCGPEPLEAAGAHYYKLVPTAGAPTLEIDGVQMHRTRGVDPFEDAGRKVESAVRRGDEVLDTCGGLGYTAIWSVSFGARHVVSVEVCPEVRQLREHNPWSAALFRPHVELIDADVRAYVGSAASGSFDCVIHDPPRFSLAGELYGREFYAHLFRVLRPAGRLFHYTGAPYSRRARRDFVREVAGRLSFAGFHVGECREAAGLLGRK